MQGNKSLKFGSAERKLTLNKTSLGISLAVTLLTWAGAELIPQLTDESGLIGIIAGLAASAIPMVVMWLRNNQDVTVEKKEDK